MLKKKQHNKLNKGEGAGGEESTVPPVNSKNDKTFTILFILTYVTYECKDIPTH